MKRLLIHIGTGKTGTSSIQNFLFINRKPLAKNFGLFYPEQGLSDITHFGELIHAHYPIVSWIRDRQTENLEKLSLALNTSGCETGIISCENFYHHFSAEDIDFLATVFKQFSVEIICYIRRQDLYMESAWKQQIKVGALKAAFPDFLQRHTQANYLEEVHANYYRMLKSWAAVFGIDKIRVKVFDKSVWINGDLIDDFLHTCGIDTEQALSALVKPALTNVAFPNELIRVVQKTNAMNLIPKARQQDFVEYLRKLNSFNESPLLSTAERMAIIKNYQPTNRALFAEFCNQPVPKCFRPVAIKNAAKVENSRPVLLEDIAVKSIVAAWKKSSFHLPVSKQSLIKTVEKIYKNYLQPSLENILQTKDNIIDRTLNTNKIPQPSPFILDFKSAALALKNEESFFYYGFSNLPPLKPPLLSSLPRCSITVNNCFVSAAVFNPLDNPKALLGGVYDNGHLIQAANYRGATAKLAIDPFNITQNQINKAFLIRGSCIYLGWLSNYFGHLLLEAPARFWFLNSIDVSQYQFVFHPLGHNASLKNILQVELAQILFDSFGIRKEQIVLADRDLYVEELIIPSSLFFLGMTVDPMQLNIYNRIKTYSLRGTALSSEKRKIYLSRRLLKKTGGRKAINEQEIENLFASYGFEIIFPEQLSLQTQIQIMSEALVVAGCEGSALHMGLFLPHSAKMIVLSTRNIVVNQLLINKLGNIETHFINAGKDRSILQMTGNWEADIAFIKEHLDKIMGHTT
jgi:capsular polysaccharide biosynthesis protein